MNSFKIACAWLVLVFGLFGAVFFLVGDQIDLIEQTSDTYARRLALLERLEQLPEREEEIAQRIEDLGFETMEGLLYEGSPNVVRSLVQRDLRELAAKHGIRLRSIRAASNMRQTGPIAYTSINVQVNATFEKMMQLISELELQEPMLKIRRISMRVRSPSTETTHAQLAVVLEVAGYSAAGQLDD